MIPYTTRPISSQDAQVQDRQLIADYYVYYINCKYIEVDVEVLRLSDDDYII